MTTQLPRIGMRLIKTSLAVLGCFIIHFLRNEKGVPVFSTIAALMCMQTQVENSIQSAFNRIIGTAIGAVFALPVVFIMQEIPWEFRILRYVVIAAALIPVMYMTVALKIMEAPPIGTFTDRIRQIPAECICGKIALILHVIQHSTIHGNNRQAYIQPLQFRHQKCRCSSRCNGKGHPLTQHLVHLEFYIRRDPIFPIIQRTVEAGNKKILIRPFSGQVHTIYPQRYDNAYNGFHRTIDGIYMRRLPAIGKADA